MQFDFLGAADNTPLTKTYRLTPDGYEVEPYPFVKNMNSYRVEANSPAELHAAITVHAEEGHCMLKGLTKEQLVNQSRAGQTTPDEPTRWVCLDLDFEEGWNSVDDFLRELAPEWSDVSYVWQHSASAGIKSKPGIRGHIWIMLEQAILPSVLKQWLMERNLLVSRLKEQISLAASGMALKWPLDITTCQNDKLLYIAPPMCKGFEDPLSERIEMRAKKQDFAPLPRTELLAAAVDHKQQEKIAQLRESAGLPRRTAKYADHGGFNILVNPEISTVTGVKHGRGFVYLNLNGGNSFGYFFPAKNPEILSNFKGEPPMRLRDVAPDFYQEYTQKLKQETYGDIRPYVFREPMRDVYFNTLYSPSEDKLMMIAPAGSKDRLADFMAQFGHPMPDPVEDWTVEFNPTTTSVLNARQKWVNLFKPTKFIKEMHSFGNIPTVPETINKVIDSVCGNDLETKDHFLNWLACLFQTRERMETAWIFHGVQGTGKGILLSRILRPLLGERHVTEWTTQAFEEKFNQPLEQTCLLWLDEFKATDNKAGDQMMNKLKSYVTEHVLTIRGMRANGYEVPNYLNVIIACNHPDPVQLTEHDRRFNVAPAQERPLVILAEEVERIQGELSLFAGFLANYKVDRQKARKVLLNEARSSMIVASQTTTDAFFSAARTGKIKWFADFLQNNMPMQDSLLYQQFERIVRNWVREAYENAANGNPVRTTRDELRMVYSYIVGSPTTPAKFTRMCNIHRLEGGRMRIHGGDEPTTGFVLPFVASREELEPYLQQASDKKLRVVNGKEDHE